MDDFFKISWDSTLDIFLTSIGIFAAIIIYTRIAGKRSFSKMSSFDFASTIAFGSILGSVIISDKVSLLQGCVGIASLYIIQSIIANARQLSSFRNLVDNKPLMLMKGQEILYENLKAAQVTESDLMAKLREANVIQIRQVKAVIFETTGDISVLHSNNYEIDLEEKLLMSVKV